MNRYLNELSGLSRCDAVYLHKVEETLPILADLWHSDLLLYAPGTQPNTAIVIAQASPHTTPPVFSSPLVGKQVGKKNEPLVFQTFRRGRATRGSRCSPTAARTAHEVHPLRAQDGKVMAVLAIEADLAEHERLKRKSHVLREALAVILQMAIAGQIDGAGALTAVREHDGLIVVDGAGQIQYASRMAEALFRRIGYSGSLLGVPLPGTDREEGTFFEALESGNCSERENAMNNLILVTKAIPLVADEETSWLSLRFKANPRYGGAFIVIDDVTEERQQEQALKIKSAMIQEIHHRVKNNLQTIAALLRLQARRASIPEVEVMLDSSINRILSIAVVHEFLSHDQESVINITEVCQRILNEVTHGIIDPSKNICLKLEGANLYLPAQQATSCALIVNELLQNAVKHGYAERSAGTVVVRLLEHGDQLCIEIADDGTGFPGPFDRGDSSHLGLQIINTLVKEDLKGRFEFANGQGVTARVTFPKVVAPPRRSQA
ncbi:MAG: sensor histidine kinase [Chloroflexi bacterium]|nr:sensor histidine kinase [Chloroflexota bacterium]